MPPTVSRTSHKVVVALLDGTRAGGFLYDFSPNATRFYLFPKETDDPSHARLLETEACKAIFFVKTHEGNRDQREAIRKEPEETKRRRVRGTPLRISFSDGEELACLTENYNPVRIGFFVYPLDPRSNNLRIFVLNANVRDVAKGEAAAGAPAAAPPGRRAPKPPAPAAPPLPPLGECSVPPEKRVEAVLRIIAGESALDVSADMEIPPGVLGHWAQVFLQHGRAGLQGGAPVAVGHQALIAELAARILALEEELARLRGGGGRGR